jgi:hypothetical protein
MSHKAAAIDGIQNNGLNWQFRLHGLITPEAKKLGAFNDRLNDFDDDYEQITVLRSESEPVVEKIVQQLHGWIELASIEPAPLSGATKLPAEVRRDLESALDDLEMVSDCCMGEINHAMDRLYDTFDYWRICTG